MYCIGAFGGFRWGLALGVLLIGAAISLALVPRMLFRSFRTRLADNNLALCMNCGYALEGLPEAHKCPECGEGYDLTRVRANWDYWLVYRRLPNDS